MKTTRRNFTKTISTIGLNSLIMGNQDLFGAPKKKLGIALVGLGYYSTDLLAPALQLTEFAELKGIVTGSPAKIPIWKAKYGIEDKNIYNYQNFDEIAKNPDIDIVYVVLPPSMHREYVERAAKAGKHVFCEKPMAPSVADCRAMIKACEKAKVKLAIGYRCQHDPNIQAYRKITRDKKFGKVVEVTSKAAYRENRTNHWKQIKALGGGVMGDMGVYAIQGARMAVGMEPIAVSAIASTTRPEIYKEVEETVNYTLEFPDGIKATCLSSFGENVNSLEIKYEKGWVKMSPQSSYSGNKGEASDGTKIDFPLKNQQTKQIDDDCLAIMNKKPLQATGYEGLNDIIIVEAIYKSAAQGGKRVIIED
ncbi:MAG: Gfo/Idh/MocA family oxidoreductase [Bacteroidota bacterium]